MLARGGGGGQQNFFSEHTKKKLRTYQIHFLQTHVNFAGHIKNFPLTSRNLQ